MISFNNLENVKENRRDRQSNIETMISNAIIFILLSIIAGLYSFPPSCLKIGNKANDLYQKLNKLILFSIKKFLFRNPKKQQRKR